MRTFIKTFQSYTKTAFFSIVGATSIFALVAAIHKLFVSTGIKGTGAEISSFILGLATLLSVLSLLFNIETLVPHLGRSLRIEYDAKLKKKKKKKKKKAARSIGASEFALVQVFTLLEHSLLRMTLGIVLVFSVARLMFSTFVATFMELDRKDKR